MRVLVAVLVLAGSLRAEWNEFNHFFRILAEENVNLVVDSQFDMIFVLGSSPVGVLGLRSMSFRNYVRTKGVTLVVASESRDVASILRAFSLGIGEETILTLNADATFQGQPDCPLIRDFARGEAPGLFTGVNALAANRAREIRGAGTALATYPAGSVRYSFQRLVQGLFSPEPLAFARIVRLGRGTLIALGDQSIFIDLMLAEEDNERFLRNLIRTARARSALVLLNGEAVWEAPISQAAQLPFPNTTIPLPDLAPEVEDFNLLIADLQRSFPMRRFSRTVLPALLLISSVILFLLLLRELLNSYVPKDPPPAGKKAPSCGWTVPARRLVALAPVEARRRLYRQANRCRNEKGFHRFLSDLGTALHTVGKPDHGHSPGNR